MTASLNLYLMNMLQSRGHLIRRYKINIKDWLQAQNLLYMYLICL